MPRPTTTAATHFRSSSASTRRWRATSRRSPLGRTIPRPSTTAVTFQELKRFDEALESFERALAIRPDYAEALNNRGNTLQELKRFDEALESYERALAIRPNYAEAHNNCGNTLQELKRFDKALESFERALAIRPDFAEAINNRGNTLQKLGRFDEALEGYERALAIRADYAEAFNNRGNTLQELKRFDEALESYERALAIRPDYAACHVNMAFLLLQAGRFAEGWQGYEWRRKIDEETVRPLSGPEWTGGDTSAKRPLFYSEQGLGDTIQFSRFACSVAARGGEVLLEVQPSLGGLLGSLEGVKVIRNGAILPEHDAELPLMSLPHVLGATPKPYREMFPICLPSRLVWRLGPSDCPPVNFESESCGRANPPRMSTLDARSRFVPLLRCAASPALP